MTDKIKLSELRAARAGMTPGPYKAEENWNNGGMALADFSLPGSCTGKTIKMLATDAFGIVATHNAADALIEIVEALIARREAVHARVEAMTAVWTDGDRQQEARYQEILANEDMCGERLERALSAVDP